MGCSQCLGHLEEALTSAQVSRREWILTTGALRSEPHLTHM